MEPQLLENILTSSVKMFIIEHLLYIAKIYNLDPKVIDIVPAFPQADLQVDIWIYLPIGFQVDGVLKTDSEAKYILKQNKNLYGLKQMPK